MREQSNWLKLACLTALSACAAAPDPSQLEFLRARILIVEDDQRGGAWLKLASSGGSCRIDAGISPDAAKMLGFAHRAAATRAELFITLWPREAPGSPPIVMRLALTPDERMVR